MDLNSKRSINEVKNVFLKLPLYIHLKVINDKKIWNMFTSNNPDSNLLQKFFLEYLPGINPDTFELSINDFLKLSIDKQLYVKNNFPEQYNKLFK